jgi:hypothetical protein
MQLLVLELHSLNLGKSYIETIFIQCTVIKDKFIFKANSQNTSKMHMGTLKGLQFVRTKLCSIL